MSSTSPSGLSDPFSFRLPWVSLSFGSGFVKMGMSGDTAVELDLGSLFTLLKITLGIDEVEAAEVALKKSFFKPTAPLEGLDDNADEILALLEERLIMISSTSFFFAPLTTASVSVELEVIEATVDTVLFSFLLLTSLSFSLSISLSFSLGFSSSSPPSFFPSTFSLSFSLSFFLSSPFLSCSSFFFASPPSFSTSLMFLRSAFTLCLSLSATLSFFATSEDFPSSLRFRGTSTSSSSESDSDSESEK
mmetsp:Transcript_27150/g.50040  ORF Transcript_27150/g.50040 Transcript_27150/m.50040 type:complete len:248 (-) Transcript_27150:418-1161(-)